MNKTVEVVTQKIIGKLEQGTKPWVKEWDGKEVHHFYQGKNFKTKSHYHGINFLQLWVEAEEKGFESEYWLTFKQAKALGGTVRKGEHGTPILWASTIEAEKQCKSCEHCFRDKRKSCPKCGHDKVLISDDSKTVWKYYKVFNVEQCEGIDYPKPKKKEIKPFEAISQAEQILKASQAEIFHNGGNRAFYRHATDSIHLPEKECFTGNDSYYATALHELTHWTGHESRLNRDFGKRFGDQAYAFEELIAEMGSAYLCGYIGIESTMENHASYLDGWLKVLKERPKALIEACSKATKAFEFLTAKLKEESKVA